MDTNFYQDWHVRKPAVRGDRGMVVSHFRAAAEAGAGVLRAGGNAIDAAVAASFAVSVVEPWMSGIGGCGYMLVYLAKEKRVRCFNFGTVAPAALDPADYPPTAGEGGDIFTWPAVKDDRNVHGYHSMAVPTQVEGVGLAWERYGSKPWADLLAPAVELAERGLPVNWMTTLRITAVMPDLLRYPESRRIYLPGGVPPVPALGKPVPYIPMGRLAETLKRIAAEGRRELYEGETAGLIAADMAAGGGSLSASDLKDYHASEVDPMARPFGAGTLFAAPGLTAGPTLFDTLGRSESAIAKGAPKPESYAAWATALEAAYKDRLSGMGDTDNKRGEQAQGSTTHLCVIDAEGNMVSLTQTLLSVFGSKTVLPQTGILMNNGILWFDPRPGRPNSLEPGKRPLCNMCPVMATHGAGDAAAPWFAMGASGGRRIMPAVMQVASMIALGGMDFEDAFHEPRIDVSGDGRATLDTRLGKAVEDAVAGHMPVFREDQTAYPNAYAKPCGVMRDPATGETLGAADVMNPVSGAAAE
jgi:gamma-glutamyltranspeptidase/glutathione hydrolase